MAIQKPYNLSLSGQTIDGNEINVLSWKVSGSISVAFSISVLKNSDNSLVWSLPKTSSYATQYSIPAGSIPNGNEYKLSVTVWDDTGASAVSDYIIFQTSSRPTVVVNTIGTVSSPSYTFSAVYTQNELIPIRSWIAYLYDLNGNKLLDSGIQTSSTLSWLVNNLQSEKSYYVEFQVTSNKGLTGSSGKILFNVLYTAPQVNVSLTAENVENAGIKLSMYVIQIIGIAEPSPPIYLNNTKIDLTANGSRMYFQNGFSLEKDFTLKLWIENPANREKLLVLNGINGTIWLEYHIIDNKFYLYKQIENSSIIVTYESKPVISNNYFVCIQQIGDNMTLIAEENI